MSAEVAIARISPEMHGMKMSLAEFAYAESVEGYIYELERGVIVVDVAKLPHARVVQNVRDPFVQYRLAHPDRIYLVAGNDSVIRMPGMESERHPDVTVYLIAPADEEEQSWDDMAPDIVVEVVSKSSVKRDYEVKREEYLSAGVRIYWIVDPFKRVVVALTRRGDTWHESRLGPGDTLTVPMLPGFALPVEGIFAPVSPPKRKEKRRTK